jgi:hypothetical protein
MPTTNCVGNDLLAVAVTDAECRSVTAAATHE